MRHYEIVFIVHPDQSEQVPAMIFVNWHAVAAKQNASCIGACNRLRELSFELCRRLCWKLKIEPAPILGH